MEKEQILFEIKSLDKMIVREIVIDIGCDNKQITITSPTPTQLQIIDYILEHDNKDIYQRDLEKVLNLRRATVSGVLQTMEKNNLITRVIDDKDTRIKKIILNETAKNIFTEQKNKLEKVKKIITKDISEEELDIFMKVMSKMKSNLKNSCMKNDNK